MDELKGRGYWKEICVHAMITIKVDFRENEFGFNPNLFIVARRQMFDF
jgi:hypothetical protein